MMRYFLRREDNANKVTFLPTISARWKYTIFKRITNMKPTTVANESANAWAFHFGRITLLICGRGQGFNGSPWAPFKNDGDVA